MSFEQIVEDCSALPTYERRSATETYLELVFFNVDMAQWDEVLTRHLGPPAKKPADKANEEQSAVAKPFGGIYEGQTLYFAEVNGSRIVAMLWPWQNAKHTTLKLAQL